MSASSNADVPDDSLEAALLRSVDGLQYLLTRFREQLQAQLEN